MTGPLLGNLPSFYVISDPRGQWKFSININLRTASFVLICNTSFVYHCVFICTCPSLSTVPFKTWPRQKHPMQHAYTHA